MLHAVIMAGGSGTRFWPESRNARPKQLLRLAGDSTMLQATVARLGRLVPVERMLIATNQSLVPAIAAQLPELPKSALLGEPCKRDTAPCIGLAALLLLRSDPDATMAVMPSDHVISPDEVFQQALRQAAALVDGQPERIVTFGIRPTYPAESFGYIERGAPLEVAAGDAPAFQVKRFREKPQAEIAREYLLSGNFYWNAGIFVWKAATIARALAARQPEMFAQLETIVAAVGQPNYADVLAREFAAIKGISIDYAVMEQATDVVVIEAPFRWDDVGSWQSLARLRSSDADGNTIAGKFLGLNTQGSIVRGPKDHLIVTLGLKDVIVVHTPDATLVANKHDEEAIRQLTKLMEERGMKEYL
ncbi:MAG: mannose-1-phosphate guanylyltransferase [Planctomycetaceae bacterium]|nr:mannose-1-phosphate guanylyltransferase [Planctomycetaceae bacterium]